jgi:hypothetical protein
VSVRLIRVGCCSCHEQGRIGNERKHFWVDGF